MSRAWALTLVIIAAASGCQPVVDTRELRYSAAVTVDGREQTLSGDYTCYHDNPFLDMGGQYWYVVRHRPLAGRGAMDLALRGAAANGVVFEIHPTLEVVLRLSGGLHEGLCAIPQEHDLDSVLYYRRSGESVYHSNTAAQPADAAATGMVLESAGRELVNRGHALHAEQHKGDDTAVATYYSVALYILPAKAIDEIGLREYLARNPLIWLKAGAKLPLDRERAREIVGYGFPFNEQVRIYRQRQDWRFTPAMTFSSDSLWQVGAVRDWVMLDPELAQTVSGAGSGTQLLTWSPPPPTIWVEYKGCRVEIPLLQFERRHVYDAAADQLVVFEPELVTLSAD